MIDVLESTQFEILRREDQLEQAMLDGNLTASLRVPDLRVGDDLELAFTVPLNDPTLRSTSHGLLFLADAPPAGRFGLTLSWEDGQEPSIKLTDDLKSVAQREDNSVTMRFDNPAIIAPPRDAPPRYNWTRIIEFSDFAGWQDVSKRFHALYDEASTLSDDSPLREEAAYIAADHTEKLAQAQAALKLVQQQVRYVYIGLNGGNFRPVPADLTWERRYGDCKGKTVMLLAILRELGIEAQAVVVANNLSTDGIDERLPNPSLFDHVLVRATIDGTQYWLDGTLPDVIEARDQPFFKYQWVLPISAQGNDVERLPDRPFALPQEMGIFDIDASAGFDEPATITRQIISRGAAALQAYFTFSAVSQNQLEQGLRTQLVGNGEWDRIDSVGFRFIRETQASVLTIKGTGPVDWEEKRQGSYSLSLPGGGFSPPQKRQRPGKDDQQALPYWQAPDYSCYATTVRLPKNTSINTWDFNSVFDTMMFGRVYYRMMELRDDKSLRMIRGSRVETPEITAKTAERDNSRLDGFDNTKAVLSHFPDETIEAWDTERPIPAADEIDWSSATVPCLPPDMAES